MVSAERIEEVLLGYIKLEQDARDNVDNLVEEIVKEDSEKNRIKRTLKSEYDNRIKLLKDIHYDLLE